MSNAKRLEHEDHRHEAARLTRALAAHEVEVRRNERERAYRRLQPLMPCDRERFSSDWPGCTL